MTLQYKSEIEFQVEMSTLTDTSLFLTASYFIYIL